MDKVPDQTGIASFSDRNSVAKGCRTVLAVIETATDKVTAMRATGTHVIAITRIDSLVQDIESLRDITKRVQERSEGLCKPPVPESTLQHTCAVLSACNTALIKLDAKLAAMASGNPHSEDLEVLQAGLRTYASALSLALDVVNM